MLHNPEGIPVGLAKLKTVDNVVASSIFSGFAPQSFREGLLFIFVEPTHCLVVSHS